MGVTGRLGSRECLGRWCWIWRRVRGIVNLVGAGCGWDDRLVARGGEGLGLVEVGAPSYVGFRFPVEIISHCV